MVALYYSRVTSNGKFNRYKIQDLLDILSKRIKKYLANSILFLMLFTNVLDAIKVFVTINFIVIAYSLLVNIKP